jgi:tetratricopeptide (TPR) repeat protein
LELLDQAITAQVKGDPAKARQLYEAALAQDPSLSGVQYQLGVVAYQMHDPERAREHLRRALAETQNVASAHGLLGVIAAQEKNYDEAFASFRLACEAAPGDPQPFFNWSEALREAGRPAEALPLLRKAVQRRPDDPLFALKWRLARIEAGQTEGLREEASEQLRLDPPSADWIMTAAALAMSDGRWDTATNLLSQARQIMGAQLFAGVLQDRFFSAFRGRPDLRVFLTERPGANEGG